MKLLGLELVRVNVPFRVDIGTAATVHRTRALLFVRVVTPDSEGWGECAALGEGTSVDPSVDEVEAAARGRGVQRLLDATSARGGQLPRETEIAPLFGSSPVDRMLGALFEMAVGDAELRLAGRSLAAALEVGAGFETLPVGAAVGIPPGHDLGILREQVREAVAGGRRPAAGQDRAGLGPRTGGGDQGRPPRPGPSGGRQRLLPHGGRRAGGSAGRLRRAVHRAAPSPRRPGGPRGVRPPDAGTGLPR